MIAMQEQYLYQTTQFALSSHALFFLRSGFAYKTIPIDDIDSIELRDGKDLRNWLWVFFIGVVLVVYAIFDCWNIYRILTDPHVHHVEIFRLIIPVIPLLLGCYSIVIALRKTKVLIVTDKKSRHYLSLREIIKQEQFQSFTGHLRTLPRHIKLITEI